MDKIKTDKLKNKNNKLDVNKINEMCSHWESLNHNIHPWHLKNDPNIDWDQTCPLDIVYTWVNGNDEKWKTKKKKYQGGDMGFDSNTNNRFDTMYELKYSLRSIFYFMPWVRRIYIVVDDDQEPEFVDFNHPKLFKIKHSDIFLDKRHLPTFNSLAIETNLFRIPGLSRYFLYLNDDCFVGRNVFYSDLFSKNGKPYFFNLYHKHKTINTTFSKEIYTFACKNTKQFLETILNKKVLYTYQWHFPIVLDKFVFEKLENEYPDLFHFNSSFRFRSKKSYHMTLLVNILSVELGLKIPTRTSIPSHILCPLKTKNYDKHIKLLNSIYHETPSFFCINDYDKEYPLKKYIQKILNYYYPRKISFER